MKHDHISFKEYTMDNLSLPSNIADLIPRDNMAHVVHEMCLVQNESTEFCDKKVQSFMA
ncbi:hypothetical protein QT237_09245 [Geobacillus stearothermophilus]|nr:hypothetical protein QT237_09245 [Geobacillus stearothermophilus]